jgi:putative two-component system response regulator
MDPQGIDPQLSIPFFAPARSDMSRVLVIDDDEAICQMLARRLSRSGYGVTSCYSSEDALQILRRAAFDLVLCDVELPGMDGLAFCARIHDSHPDLPVVILTGYGGVELARAALQKGATDFVTKPIELDALSLLVEKNLERKRVERGRELSRDSRLILQFIEALAAAIDAKESATAQHSLRVMELSGSLARALGLEEAECQSLELAALVHDVGKIGIPDRILQKPGELDEAEWELVRTHPVVGSQIVGRIEELSYVADVVRHHHERIDGEGYPDRLEGEAIPLAARIIAVADAYEVMTADRVYRSRLPQDEALTRLQASSGTQFDSELVAKFCSLNVQ